jgi:hypothetical protein
VKLTPAASDLLTTVLEQSSQCRKVRAWRSDCTIGVTLLEDLVRSWATTDQVGIKQTRPVGEGALLPIAVEKDFRCLYCRIDQDERDAGVIAWPSVLLQIRRFISANPPSKFIEAFWQVTSRTVQGRRYEKHLAPHVQRQV